MASELAPGAEVEIGWSPNRYLRLLYRGKALFEVCEARQSKLQKEIVLRLPLFERTAFVLPYILRNGVRTSPFIAGRNGGLTLLNCIGNE